MTQLAQVNTQRMYQLADFLETVPPSRFNLKHWQEEKAHPVIGNFLPYDRCGFAGCAMGWAVHAKLFPGLTLAVVPNGLMTPEICYKGATNMDAAGLVFGLKEGSFLFHSDSYSEPATPYKVATRLRRFAQIVERRLQHTKARPTLRLVA